MRRQTNHTHEQERVTEQQIESMPALLDTTQAASIVGSTPLVMARRCARGEFVAVKVGREWRLNKAKFLEAVGLA